MNQSQIALLSVLLLFLPLIPAAMDDFTAFAVTGAIGFILVLYLLYHYKPWRSTKAAINSMYFSGIFALGVAVGVFLALPFHPRHIAELGFVYSLPFIVTLLMVVARLVPKLALKELVTLGNGIFMMLVVIIIGAIIGRFFHNFYETLVIYSGFLVLGVLTYLYIHQGVKQ
ncbi:MAG: hypothetical protein OWQ54_01825 [Sulfolobaceae archaeon]|nr:hypothetical protein [Sulfolobaceae archaeon]